jgi:uncharacterized protein HemX
MTKNDYKDPFLERLEQDSAQLEEECNVVMSAIDWQESAEAITGRIPFKPPVTQLSRRRWGAGSKWQWAAAAVVLIFSLGIGLGYLLFHQRVSPQDKPLLAQNDAASEESLERLEATLAKREVRRYFQQSQLVLTDLMEQCTTDASFSMKNQMDTRRIRTLLSKGRYFNQNLEHPDLMSSRKLLEKIEWLLYEIVTSGDDTSCQKLQELQNYIKQERLLLKIRLVGKELSISEV